MEQRVMRRTKYFNERTRESPMMEDLWLDYADFQEEAVKTMHGGSATGAMPQAVARLGVEKRAAVVDGGLRHNPSSVRLRLEQLQLAGRVKEHSEVDKIWKKAIDRCDQASPLWMEYMCFKEGHFDSFSVTEQRDLYSQALRALEQRMEGKKKEMEAKERAQGVFIMGKSMLGDGRGDLVGEADMLNIMWDYCMMERAAG
ncbi:unnamed protein product [Discosporangium mesarthrocarpum]